MKNIEKDVRVFMFVFGVGREGALETKFRPRGWVQECCKFKRDTWATFQVVQQELPLTHVATEQ